jgi:endoglucanase
MTKQKTEQYRLLQVGAQQIKLLERLCKACAVSGDEGEVRKIVLEQVKPLADEVKVDALGNVLAIKHGQGAKRLRVMLAAHMDEVGFMITSDEEDGIYRFDVVGGLDPRILVGKAVWIGKDHLPGVIGTKPIHLTERDETRSAIPVERLRIDTGPVSGKVKVGDRVTFAGTFTRLGPTIRAKALDNRLGVTTLIELLRNAPANIDILAAFTVQEEIGLRGARVASYGLDPDLAIAIDSTPAYDLPTWNKADNTQYNARLGAGPAIYIHDSGTLSDPRLIRHLVATAEAHNLPYQFRQPGGGGTDAGAIHRQRAGIPSVSVSVPGRYHHTPMSFVRLADWQATLALLHAGLTRLTPAVLATPR